MCNCNKFTSSVSTYSDLLERCGVYDDISPYLSSVSIDTERWFEILVCNDCNQYWAKEYPFGEYHGGGTPCLYQVTIEDKTNYFKKLRPKLNDIRQKHEDKKFLESLGEEVGPELCRSPGCTNKHIKNSSMCKQHHFLMIKNA